MLHEALDRPVATELKEKSVSNAIVESIRCFLSTSTDRDKPVELQTKQVMLTACAYFGSCNSIGLEQVNIHFIIKQLQA